MSAGPGVHINLCCNISPKSGRETLSNGRACSILALGVVSRKPGTLPSPAALRAAVEASASARLHSSFGPRRAIRFSGYREALEDYAHVDNGFKMVGQLRRGAKEANDGDAWLNSIDSTRATRRLDNTNPKTSQ